MKTKTVDVPTFEDWYADNKARFYQAHMSEEEVAHSAWNYAWRKASELLDVL